jgi:hypothetical protein
MKRIAQFIAGFFMDNGIPSSKRLIGILCGLCLCFVFVYKGVTKDTSEIPSSLVESIAFLAFGSLGLTTVQQYWKSKSFSIGGDDDKPKKDEK